MPTIADVRRQFPQYDDLSDDELAGAIHRKFYPDLPEAEFRAKIGLGGGQGLAAAQGATGGDTRLSDFWEKSTFVRPLYEGVRDAFSTVGGVARGEIPAMMPEDPAGRGGVFFQSGGVTNPQVETAATTLGALATPASPAAGTGKTITAIAAARRGERPVPTRKELKAAGGSQIHAAEQMGVVYDPVYVAGFAQVARDNLRRQGFNEVTAPNTFRVLDDMERPGPTIYNSVNGLHTAQQSFRKGQGQDRVAGEGLVRVLDDIMANPPPEMVMAGPAAEAGALLREGKGNWAAFKRSQKFSGKQKKAERRASAANSGLNLDNTMRSKVAELLDKIDDGREIGWTKQEYDAMEAFVNGGPARNFTRKIANYLGGGGGLGAVITGGIGGIVGGLPGVAAVAGTGLGMKMAQNALGKRAMNQLDEMIRMRSPMYGTQAMPIPPPMPPGPLSSMGQRFPLMMLQPPPQNGGGGF